MDRNFKQALFSFAIVLASSVSALAEGGPSNNLVKVLDNKMVSGASSITLSLSGNDAAAMWSVIGSKKLSAVIDSESLFSIIKSISCSSSSQCTLEAYGMVISRKDEPTMTNAEFQGMYGALVRAVDSGESLAVAPDAIGIDPTGYKQVLDKQLFAMLQKDRGSNPNVSGNQDEVFLKTSNFTIDCSKSPEIICELESVVSDSR